MNIPQRNVGRCNREDWLLLPVNTQAVEWFTVAVDSAPALPADSPAATGYRH